MAAMSAACRALLIAATLAGPAQAVTHSVSDVAGLRAAVAVANPGDEIVLAPGTYLLTAGLNLERSGTPAAPIVLRAATPQQAVLRSDTLVMIRARASDWRIEGLLIEGVCAIDDNCEHALQILSGAQRLIVRNNHFREFNAPIKGNGEPLGVGGSYVFADDVLVERSRFYATRPRLTANPVTFIDVVGGKRWVIRGNLIYDFMKAGGDGISYAAFLKGNGSDGVFERNLVICQRRFGGGERVGLSFGGGGTGAQFCEGGSCVTEHRNGVMRNNLIVNCNDVGIYLNRAQNTLIEHNTLYNTAGIDVRFSTSSATVRNNVLSGRLRNRDGGSHSAIGNLTELPLATLQSWFADPAAGDFALRDGAMLVDQGAAGGSTVDDYCGDARGGGAPDRGALEYDRTGKCDTVLDREVRIFRNGFEAS